MPARPSARARLTLAVLLGGLATGAAADASPDDRPAPEPDAEVGRAPSRWFGWQVGLVDVGTVALLAGGGALTSTSSSFAFLPVLGGVSYLAGGPLVHAANHDASGAWRSLGLRVGIPVVGGALVAGLAAATSSGGTSDVCSPRDQRTCAAIFGAVVGVGVGMIAAMVTDWITSSTPVSSAEDPRVEGQGPATNGPTWSVVALPLRDGPGLAVAGRF